jgi:hypothetical protein
MLVQSWRQMQVAQRLLRLAALLGEKRGEVSFVSALMDGSGTPLRAPATAPAGHAIRPVSS